MIVPDDIDERICRNVRDVAAERGVLHMAIAAELGISIWTMSNLLCGRQRWAAYQLIGAAIILDVPIERLLQ